MKQRTIHIENLSIGYLGKTDVKVVADRINAGINCGELTCLLGANGVGKSTLLRTLSAFQPKLGGKIEIVGKEIDAYTDKELSTVISVVLTEKCDIRNMTVHELVGLGRSPYTGFWGTLRGEDKEVVERSIALVKIQNLAHRMVHTLSDGERQKVMIAKALAQETPVIFLDEPTAFLDFPSKVEMMQLLHRLSRQTNKTIFLSTHDLELALQIADKIWLMDKMNGVTIGTPEDLSLSGKLSSFFARKGIVFDLETGLFRVDNEYTSQIRLVGHGQKYAMVRKALQRNGILANRTVESDTYIETGDLKDGNGFILHPQEGEAVTLNSIEELVQFHASSVDGKCQYDFTEEDLHHVHIKDVTFDESSSVISFNFYFKGIKSRTKATLPYSLRDYFLQKFKVDQEYVSQHAMRGVYEFIDGFIGKVLQGTDGRFVPGNILSKGKDDFRNSMTFTFPVFDKKKNRKVLEITRDLNGFRLVDEIVSELKIYPTYALLQVARDALNNMSIEAEKNFFQIIRRKFISRKWMLKTEYEYHTIPLELSEKALYGQGDCLDIYLEDPRWLLRSAELKDKDLYLTVQLESVNSLALKNHVFHLVIKGVR